MSAASKVPGEKPSSLKMGKEDEGFRAFLEVKESHRRGSISAEAHEAVKEQLE